MEGGRYRCPLVVWLLWPRGEAGEAPRPLSIDRNELSPRSTQSISRASMSPMINALTCATNATVAAVIASVEEDTEVPVHVPTEKNYQESISQT